MAKQIEPNEAQLQALAVAVVTGELPADTSNQVRTAQACVRRGWATEVDGRYPITEEGSRFVQAAPDDDDIPVDDIPADDIPADDIPADDIPVVDLRADELADLIDGDDTTPEADDHPLADEADAEEPTGRHLTVVPPYATKSPAEVHQLDPKQMDVTVRPWVLAAVPDEPEAEPAAVVVDEPTPEVEPVAVVVAEPTVEVAEVEVAPAGGKPGLLTGAVAGLRVHHLEPVPTCAGTGHRNGVMTGQARVTKGRDHVQVNLDCGHVRWPLLRVLIAGTQPGHTPPTTATAAAA